MDIKDFYPGDLERFGKKVLALKSPSRDEEVDPSPQSMTNRLRIKKKHIKEIKPRPVGYLEKQTVCGIKHGLQSLSFAHMTIGDRRQAIFLFCPHLFANVMSRNMHEIPTVICLSFTQRRLNFAKT